MTLQQYQKINNLIKQARKNAESKLTEEGENLMSLKVETALSGMEKKIIENSGFSLEEYNSVKKLAKKRGDERIEKLTDDVNTHFKKNVEDSSSLKGYIADKFEEIKTLIKETVFKFPKEISVKKPDWFKLPIKVKQDEAIEVKNFPEEIEISNFPEQKEFPKEIDIKKPDWWKSFDIKNIFDKVITVKLSKDQIKPKYSGDAIQVKVTNLDEGKQEQWIPQNPTTATGQRLIKEAVEDNTNALGKSFNTNEILEVGTDTYFCKETKAGIWWLMKIDTNSVFTHATNLNNPSVNSYADARSGYAGLTYQTYNLAFN